MGKEEQIEKEVVDDDGMRPWGDIEGGLLQSISNLSLSDRIRFRLTCKGWKNMKLPPRSIPLHIESSFESQECPWLVVCHNTMEGVYINYFHPVCNNAYLTRIPELTSAIILHSKYGWLLMSRDGYSYFFFHPLKRAIINLPNPPFQLEFTVVSFSSPPTSPDCVVFAITQLLAPLRVAIYFCRRGHASWQTRRYEMNSPFMPAFCNPVFYHGAFYCLDMGGKVGVFDLAKEVWEIIPNLVGPKMFVCMNFIAECDGDLISVFFGKVGTLVCVFRLDWKQMKWVKLEHLGNRMMFVSHTTSILVPAITKGTENKIYLPRFQEGSNVFFSLYTGKYQIFDSEYRGESWYKTFEYMNCTWIDLNNSRIDFNINPYSHKELDWLSNAPEDLGR